MSGGRDRGRTCAFCVASCTCFAWRNAATVVVQLGTCKPRQRILVLSFCPLVEVRSTIENDIAFVWWNDHRFCQRTEPTKHGPTHVDSFCCEILTRRRSSRAHFMEITAFNKLVALTLEMFYSRKENFAWRSLFLHVLHPLKRKFNQQRYVRVYVRFYKNFADTLHLQTLHGQAEVILRNTEARFARWLSEKTGISSLRSPSRDYSVYYRFRFQQNLRKITRSR